MTGVVLFIVVYGEIPSRVFLTGVSIVRPARVPRLCVRYFWVWILLIVTAKTPSKQSQYALTLPAFGL